MSDQPTNLPSRNLADSEPNVSRARRFYRSRWLLWRQHLAFWVGALLVGLVALAFAWLTDQSFALFKRMLGVAPWLPLLVTPAGFALLAWVTQRWFVEAKGSGIPQVIAALESPSRRFPARVLALPVAAVRMFFTLGALLVGGSAGREGPTVHVGAAVIYAFGRRLGLHGRRTIAGLILAGGAAGIAAAFNTPLAGIVFAIEELSRTFEQRFSGLVLTAVLIGGGRPRHCARFGEHYGGWCARLNLDNRQVYIRARIPDAARQDIDTIGGEVLWALAACSE
nr:chloride channel protein [Pseudomonas aeruginosa]